MCNPLVVVSGHYLLLPPSAHGLRAEPRTELLLAPPWARGVGSGKSHVSPGFLSSHPPQHPTLWLNWAVSGGLFRTTLVFGRHQNAFLAPHPQGVLLLGWLQKCLLPAPCEGCPIPIAIGRLRLESDTACVTPSLRCLLHVTRECECGTQL